MITLCNLVFFAVLLQLDPVMWSRWWRAPLAPPALIHGVLTDRFAVRPVVSRKTALEQRVDTANVARV